jgi:hypothetical protein
LKIKNTILQADVPTKTGYIFTREAIEKALIKFKEKVKEKRAVGMIRANVDFSSPGTFADVSHLIENIYLDENNNLVAEIDILSNTSSGAFLFDLYQRGIAMFSPCGRINEISIHDNKTIKDCAIDSIDAWELFEFIPEPKL